MVVSTAASIDAHRLDTDIRKADLWLTPQAVEGFDPGDFAFLAEGEHQALVDAVRQFRVVAQQVPSREPASLAQVEQAKSPFDQILAILRPEKYGDLDAFLLGKRLEQALDQTRERPVWVRDFVFESGLDTIGEQALWIWVLVDDEVLAVEHPADQVRDVIELVETCLRRITTRWWPFIHFRTVSEQRELVG